MSSEPTVSTAGLYPYRLALRQPWRSALGSWSVRQGWLVKLGTTDGLVGYGDCAPLPEAGTELLTVAETELRSQVARVFGQTPSSILDDLDGCNDTPAVRCGLESAVLDVLSKSDGKPLYRWLDPGAVQRVSVNAMLGTLEGDVIGRARDAVRRGYGVLKIKLGVMPWSQELVALRAMAQVLPRAARLRLDANGSWEEMEAREIIASMKDLPVESLEEPLSEPDYEALCRLQGLATWPIALDESLRYWSIPELLGAPPVQRFVLKPMALGGLLPAAALAIRARAENVSSVVTTTVDSAVGVRVACHLAATLDGTLAHGLATSEWLAEDLGLQPTVAEGHMFLDEIPGTGFVPNPDLRFEE